MFNRCELLAKFRNGENITRLLREHDGGNSEQSVEIAYDLQAGSYISLMNDPKVCDHQKAYARFIADSIWQFVEPGSVLEAGAGEGTTLSFVLEHFPDATAFGFDISWSRIYKCRQWLRDNDRLRRAHLCTASLFSIPLPDNSIDVVYTSHSIEPNGGREVEAINELIRVAKKFVILLEPAYDFANDETRARMESLGYCTKLKEASIASRGKVIRHELSPFAINPLNPTGITVIEKKTEKNHFLPKFVCPITHGELLPVSGALYSPTHLVAYPVIDKIPCLRVENAVTASSLQKALEH